MTPDLVPARPAEADELRTFIERVSEKTGKALKPTVKSHPAAAFGDKAEAAGWRVEYRAARGPLTTRHRPDEPDERGRYALVKVTRAVDTVGVRAVHPDGRRIAAWWVGSGDDATFDEGWTSGTKSNPCKRGIQALTRYLTEDEEDEMSEEVEQEERSELEEEAVASWEETATESWALTPPEGYAAGYLAGHAAAVEKAGDAYGEGYAAGLAAVAGQARVWVKTRKRLDALRPGDVILGKGERWYLVATSHAKDHEWMVTANGALTTVSVTEPGKRLVDVVEEIALADALKALKDGDMGAEVAA